MPARRMRGSPIDTDPERSTATTAVARSRPPVAAIACAAGAGGTGDAADDAVADAGRRSCGHERGRALMLVRAMVVGEAWRWPARAPRHRDAAAMAVRVDRASIQCRWRRSVGLLPSAGSAIAPRRCADASCANAQGAHALTRKRTRRTQRNRIIAVAVAVAGPRGEGTGCKRAVPPAPAAPMDVLNAELERTEARQSETARTVLGLLETLLTDTVATRDLARRCAAADAAPAAAALAAGTDSAPPAEAQRALEEAVQALKRRAAELCSKISSEHRDLHAAVSRLGKAIDRVRVPVAGSRSRAVGAPSCMLMIVARPVGVQMFAADAAGMMDPAAFAGCEQALNKLIAQHLFRHGHFQAASEFVNETCVDFDRAEAEPFVTMFRIMESMRAMQTGPAVEWCAVHRGPLRQRGSSLEFKLHRIEYLRLLQTSTVDAALAYARNHLEPFLETHHTDIRRLMACVLYRDRLAHSPYADLVERDAWREVEMLFARDYCAMLGMTLESPLSVAVAAGGRTLPVLQKMVQVLRNKSPSVYWTSKEELPVEVDLGRDMQYHSVFACPVSREVGTDDNPPMLLICGHVIARQSLQRLARGALGRLKCPYCPTEQTLGQARRIYF